MFKTNPARTWLTIAGMGVGTGAVVTLVGLGFGLQNIILEQIVFGETLLSLTVNNPPSRVIQLNPQTAQQFLQLDHVLNVAPLASFSSLITYGSLTGNTFLQGAEPAYFRYTGAKTVAGRLFDDEHAAEDTSNVIVSAGLLKLFEVEDPEAAIGRRVSFRVFVPRSEGTGADEVQLSKTYTIVGVTNEESRPLAIVPLSELGSHFPITTYERVHVRVDASEFLDPVTEEIIEQGFAVTALSKTVDQANKIFQGIQVVLAVFGSIALVVSAIGMFNTMTVTLLERTGEIGIMRTLGASARDIWILFVSESVMVGFLGGLMGISMGVGLGFTLNTLVNIAATNFGGQAMKLFAFPFTFLLFIAIFSAIVGFMTGMYPARRAASINPLDAIRGQ
jgi:putative ABC transport system permease protein